MCLTLYPEIPIAVRVGTRPEVSLMGCSEEKAYGISLFSPFQASRIDTSARWREILTDARKPKQRAKGR